LAVWGFLGFLGLLAFCASSTSFALGISYLSLHIEHQSHTLTSQHFPHPLQGVVIFRRRTAMLYRVRFVDPHSVIHNDRLACPAAGECPEYSVK
jgi:hypothetical protein